MNECPECGSNKIVKSAVIKDLDRGFEFTLRVAVDENPEAWVFKNRAHSNLRAEVCGNCGFLQPYAADPNQLWEAYRTSISDVE